MDISAHETNRDSLDTQPDQTSSSNTQLTILKFLKNLDLHLLLLVGISFAINFPYWDKTFMVGHDTKNTYLVFHYFYNHLVWYSELPHWLPFGEYGYNSLFYQLCDFSPSTYVSGLIGWILGVKDTLILFKLGVFGDQLIFLFGLHLLTRRLYKQHTTSFLVCLMGISSVIWTWQIYWCLRQYYLLPLVLYFFYRFFNDQISWAFWTGILTLQLALVGGLPYWAPIYAFLFIIMSIILLPTYWRSLNCLLRPSLRDLLLISLILASAVAIAYVITTCLTGLHNYAPGRSMGEMRTNLKTYLTYVTPIWGELHSFIDGTLPERLTRMSQPEDLNLYVGLLSVFGFAVAFIKCRNIWFYSITGGMIAIILLADSGIISWLSYLLMPGLNKFRHLGLLLEIAKVLLLLAGGFGIEIIMDSLLDKDYLLKNFSPLIFLSLLAALCLIVDLLISTQAYIPSAWASPMVLQHIFPEGGLWVIERIAVWALVVIAIFVIPRITKFSSFFSGIQLQRLVVFACLIDMVCFQGYHWTNRCIGSYAGSLELEPLVFAQSRTTGLSVDAYAKHNILMSSPGGAYLAFYANALQHDLCTPLGRVDIFPKGVHELVSARGATPTQYAMAETFLPPNDPQLMTVMGCGAPKLRFVTQARYSESDQQLSDMIRSSTTLDSIAILRGHSQTPINQQATETVPMFFKTTYFNANKLDVDVLVTPGKSGWLIFADAYDPQWKAYVNGIEKPVLEAYRAFKAVQLDAGISKVSFVYKNTKQNLAMALLMLLGIILSSSCIAGLGHQLFNKGRD